MGLCSGLDAICKQGQFYGYRHKLYLEEGETRVRLELNSKEAVITHIKQERGVWSFCGLNNPHVLSVFRCDYGVVFFCFDPSQAQNGLV